MYNYWNIDDTIEISTEFMFIRYYTCISTIFYNIFMEIREKLLYTVVTEVHKFELFLQIHQMKSFYLIHYTITVRLIIKYIIYYVSTT